MAIVYDDEYLKNYVTPDRVAEAAADISALNTPARYTVADVEKLSELRTYILICIQSTAEETDVFAHKLKIYRSEFDRAVIQAEAAAANANGTLWSPFSLPVERG